MFPSAFCARSVKNLKAQGISPLKLGKSALHILIFAGKCVILYIGIIIFFVAERLERALKAATEGCMGMEKESVA